MKTFADAFPEQIVGKLSRGDAHQQRGEWVVPMGDDEGTVGFVKAGSQPTAEALADEAVKRVNAHKNLIAALEWALGHVENACALADRNDPDKLLLRKAKATLAAAKKPVR